MFSMISDIMITEDEDESPEYVRVRDMIIGDVYDVLEKYHISWRRVERFFMASGGNRVYEGIGRR